MDFVNMSAKARQIIRALNDAGYDPKNLAAIALAEEVGEFVGAARRYMGMARRNGSFDELSLELADVVITAFVAAEVFDIDIEMVVEDKLRTIFNRGWRE